MNEFEKQMLNMLSEFMKSQDEHNSKVMTKFDELDVKINTIMEQTAKNAELKVSVDENKDETEKLKFEIELIKSYIRN